jgi:hypothetical protein
MDSELLHATSVLIEGSVLLIAGRPGAGKSDMALRLIDRGAMLVSDDYTRLEARGGALYALAPPTITGRIEIRGIGIADVASGHEGPVALMLDLDGEPPRLPDEPLREAVLCGVAVPVLPFRAFEPSAPIKAEWAMRMFGPAAPR